MKVKRMGITEILRRIWLFSANKIKSSESFSKQPTQIIVDLNSSLWHIIVTKKYSGKPCRGLLWLIIMCLHDSSKLYSARQNCAVRNIYNRRAKHLMKNMLKTFNIINFAAFFRVDFLFCIEVWIEKVGGDNEKALKLDNSTVFHRSTMKNLCKTE